MRVLFFGEDKMILVVNIPLEPLTHNMAYPTNRNTGGRHISSRAKEYKKSVSIIVSHLLNINPSFKFDPSKHYLSMGIEFRSPTLIAQATKGKNAKPKRISQNKPDTSNCIKLLEDSICDAMGIEDHFNLDFDYVRFRYSEEPLTTVLVRLNPVENILDN